VIGQHVKATLVDDLFGPGGDAPGAFQLHGEPPRLLHFRCPCCGDVIGGASLRPENPAGWDWDGSREHPTLSPSLLVSTGDGNGGECTHDTRKGLTNVGAPVAFESEGIKIFGVKDE